MAAYANAADLVVRYDESTIADLLSDTGTPEADLDGSARLTKLLQAATGRVNSAIRIGNNYTEADIDQLLGEDGEGAEHLKDIVCAITMQYLIRRRPERYQSAMDTLQQIEEQMLEPIRQGKRLFDLEGRASEGATIQGDEIVTADIVRTNPITQRTHHFYPNRPSSLPTSY